MIAFNLIKPKLIEICEGLHVYRLDLFGSVTSSEFRPDSDVDVLVEFDPNVGDLFNRYFTLKEELESLFGRPVDVVTVESLSNPYFIEAVERSRVNVYSAERQETPI
ncbi:hypothetical protein GC175_15775 [bacterium]|nr:hypothetical protein [bacterium]